MSERTDLGKSFEKLKKEMFITVNGCLVEVLPDHKFRWNGYIGSFTEVAEKIREAGMALQNSIRQPL
jgi:hypothetical protein